MNSDLPAGHRDPRTEMVPVRYLQLAAEMVMAQQNREYWTDVPVPSAPTNRIQYEELRQVAVFLPMILVPVVYYFAGFVGAGVAFLVALPVMSMLHKSVQHAIACAGREWFDRDRGRYSFTKFMCNEFDLHPEDITIDLILKMSKDFMCWVTAAVQVNRDDAAREGRAREGVARRHWNEAGSGVGSTAYKAGNGLIAAGAVAAGMADEAFDAARFDISVNPATGLPMIGHVFDVNGNVFGTSNDDHWSVVGDFHHSSNGGFANADGYDWNDS